VDAIYYRIAFALEDRGSTLASQGINIVIDNTIVDFVGLVSMEFQRLASVKSADCQEVIEVDFFGELKILKAVDILGQL
jgi:hypothetical protein